MRAPTTVPGPLAPTAATMITPPRRAGGAAVPPLPPSVYYDIDEPIHRRPVWPWIAALLFVVGAAIGGWFLYHQISNKLAIDDAGRGRGTIVNENEQNATREHQGRRLPRGREATREPHDCRRARVQADPGRGDAAARRATTSRIYVSTGKPKVAVPPLEGA